MTLAAIVLGATAACSSNAPPVSDPVEYVRACGPAFSPPLREPVTPVLKWTPDGSKILFNKGTSLYIVASDGSSLTEVADTAPSYNPNLKDKTGAHAGLRADISPDGSRIVYTSCEYATEEPRRDEVSLHHYPDYRNDFLSYDYEIVVIGIDGGDPIRLTQNLATDHYPAWSPDGSRIAYISDVSRALGDDFGIHGESMKNLYAIAPYDGAGVETLTPAFYAYNPDRRQASFYPPEWSPDGGRIAFIGQEERQTALYVATRDGSRLRRIARDVVGKASWSSGGQRLAFMKFLNDRFIATLHTICADGSDARKVSDLNATIQWDAVNGVSWSPDGSTFLIATSHPNPRLGEVNKSFVIGNDGVEIHRLSNSYAAWSPDGKRLASVWWRGRIPHDTENSMLVGDVWLYTVAPDGSDRRDLVAIGDDGEPMAANPK